MRKQQAALASRYHSLHWCKVAVAVEAVKQRRVSGFEIQSLEQVEVHVLIHEGRAKLR